MAKHLARIHGTEEDKVNCPFYFKIGACRHADRCSRLHHKPAFSQTLLFQHLYQPSTAVTATATTSNPAEQQQQQPQDQAALEDFLCFYEDFYMELSKFGRLEGIYVADNVGDHMIGHLYAKFRDEEDATDCLQVMHGRYYNGRLILVEYSPVTDFREARCRDFDEGHCQRGGYCNFLHVKPVPYPLLQSLEEDAEADRRRQHQQQQSNHHRSSSPGGSRRHSKKRRRDHSPRDHRSGDPVPDDSPPRRGSGGGGGRPYHHHHHHHHHNRRDRRSSRSRSSSRRD